jgi:hypothetical protein
MLFFQSSRESWYEMAGLVTFGEQMETINFPGASFPPNRPQSVGGFHIWQGLFPASRASFGEL